MCPMSVLARCILFHVMYVRSCEALSHDITELQSRCSMLTSVTKFQTILIRDGPFILLAVLRALSVLSVCFTACFDVLVCAAST